MKALHAILVAVVAASLTVLPVSAAEMRTSMVAGSMAPDTKPVGPPHQALHADCCHQSQPCDKKTEDEKDCGHSGACAVKCSVLTAATVSVMDVASPSLSSPEAAPFIEKLRSTREHPPLPPPRV